MNLQVLKKLMLGSAMSLEEVSDDTLYDLGLTEEQQDAWYANIEEARERYIAAVLSIDEILKR